MTGHIAERKLDSHYLVCNRCGGKSFFWERMEDWPDDWMFLGDDIHLCPHCAHEFEEWLEGEPFPTAKLGVLGKPVFDLENNTVRIEPDEDWIEEVADSILEIRQLLEETYGKNQSDKFGLTIAVKTLNKVYSKVTGLRHSY